MKKKLRVLLSILGVSTLAVMGAGCSAGDSIKTGIDQLFCKHEYSEFVETKAPTCYEEGEQERTCGKCGKVDKEDIEKTEHTQGVFFGAKSPTCTEVGYTPAQKCGDENCGAIIQESEIVPALGHDEYQVDGESATCLADGHTDGIGCHRCGNIVSGYDLIKATGHSWVAHTDTFSTCTSNGTQGGYVCEDCGVTDAVTYLPMNDHNFIDGVCSVCSQEKELLTAVKSTGNYNNVLNTQENGLYSYKFLSDGDYVRNESVTLERGETLVCDFALATDKLAQSGWFGIAFGDGTDIASYPNQIFGMRYYADDSIRNRDEYGALSVDTSKNINDIISANGQNVNYRILLTYNQDGTYSYKFMRSTVGSNNTYFVVDEHLNFNCPSPTSLYLLTAYNPVESTDKNDFMLTDLSFYKLG